MKNNEISMLPRMNEIFYVLIVAVVLFPALSWLAQAVDPLVYFTLTCFAPGAAVLGFVGFLWLRFNHRRKNGTLTYKDRMP